MMRRTADRSERPLFFLCGPDRIFLLIFIKIHKESEGNPCYYRYFDKESEVCIKYLDTANVKAYTPVRNKYVTFEEKFVTTGGYD